MSEDLDKLDRLCAEIMGFRVQTDNDSGAWIGTWSGDTKIYNWQPTRKIAQAWEMLEKFECKSINHKAGMQWECWIH